ncbi:MAG: efflux RND transporter permease subunit [Acidobacteria bacterium]|nr:efflux RND transporter permease subunit [Candidatus Sulfomarinibacter kjeldsenii]
MRLTDIPLDRPIATLMLLLSLTVLGTVAVFMLPLDFMPIINEPEIDMEIPFPGAHPLEALREVVEPIEEEIATIPDVKRILAFTQSGSARMEVIFDWGVDIDIKKMEVREAVDRARPELPETIGHISIRGDTDGGSAQVLAGRISAERNLSESWDLLDRRIGRPLERIKGVARVDLYGVEQQQVRINLDLDALRRHGIDAGEVLNTVNAANQDVDAGVIRGDVVRYEVRTLTRFQSADEIAALRVGRDGLRVGDVAVVEMREPRLDYGRHLDRSFAVGIDVYKEPSANTIEVVEKALARIEEIRADPQLEGINVLIWENQGEAIRNSLKGLRNAGIYGGLMAVAILHFFLRRFRTTLIVATAIPFSLLVTCGAMYALGSQFNVLTLLGLMLGVGMLVDNAVVVIENIHRYEGMGNPAPLAARLGARQVALAVVASTATSIFVWSWLFVSERDTMIIIFSEVALTICLAVACSLLISLTFIPLAAARFAPADKPKPGIVVRKIVPAYRRVLNWTLDHRLVTLTCLFVVAGSAAWPIMKIEKSGDIPDQTREVPIFARVHDDVSKEVLEGYVDQVEEWVFSRKEELGFDSVYSWYSEHGFCMTRVYLPETTANPKAIERLREQLREGLPVIAGVSLEVGDRDMWRHRGGQDRRMVSVSLHGEDPEFLEELSMEVEERMRGLDHLEEIWGPTMRGTKELRLMVDADAAHSLEVSPRSIADAVGFAFRGRRMRRFQGPDGEVEMVLGLPDDAQPGIDALADLPVPNRSGGYVPLSSVAEITIARTPERIRRENRQTTQEVTAQFDKDAVTTEEAKALVEERMLGFTVPEGYSWDFGQWGHDRDEALGTMFRGVLLSLVAVILLMAALFESFTQPFAILITLMLAFFGAFWSLWLGGFDLNPIAFMGIVILIGIVVNNGIVLVDHVNSLRVSGVERRQALIEGCGDRLRPVVMTAITTIFGLVPLVVARATVAGAYIDSIAVVVIGGLATSTFFTLLALPVWYTALEDIGAAVLRALPIRTSRNRKEQPNGSVLSG